MGVMEVVKRAGGDSGTRVQGSGSAQVTYDVQTEDADDTQGVVLEHFRSNSDLLYLYDSYQWGDTIDAFMFCKSIAATRTGSTLWQVTLQFETPKPEDSNNEGKPNKGDPLRLPNEISITTTQETVPVTTAGYMGGFTGRMDAYTQNARMDGIVDTRQLTQTFFDSKAIVTMNSMMNRYDPPLEKQVSYVSVNYTCTFLEYPMAVLEHVNTTNSAPFILESYGKKMQVDQGTALFKGFSGRLELFHKESEGGVHGGVAGDSFIFCPYWRMSYNFLIKPGADPFDIKVVDQGFFEKPKPPQATPQQVPLAPNAPTEDELQGMTDEQIERLGAGAPDVPAAPVPATNERGEMIGPVNLDGDGHRLPIENLVMEGGMGAAPRSIVQPVLIQWKVYGWSDFNNVLPQPLDSQFSNLGTTTSTGGAESGGAG